MRWLEWFSRHRGSADTDEPRDLDLLLVEGLRDPAAARRVIAQLQREQKSLVRQRQVLDVQLRRLTSGRVKVIARSTDASYGMPGEMLRHEMREASDATRTQAGILRTEQVAAVEVRLKEIDRALAQLHAYVRQAR
jgi:hypothetical protein